MLDQRTLKVQADLILTKISESREEAMVFCLGYLEQAVKSFLRGGFTLVDLENAQQLTETVLDLHRDREANRPC